MTGFNPAAVPAPASGANGGPAQGAVANGGPANGAVASGSPFSGAVASGSPFSGAVVSGAPSNGAAANGAPPGGGAAADPGAPPEAPRLAPARPAEADTGDRAPSAESVMLDGVERAVADVAAGRPVIVVDDAGRENEGDIIVAASKMTPALMAFMIRHTSGVICVPLTGPDLDRLQLPLMTAQN